MIDNFLGGIAWGLGLTLGVAIVISTLTFILRQLDVVPYVGNFVTQITTYVEEHTHQPTK